MPASLRTAEEATTSAAATGANLHRLWAGEGISLLGNATSSVLLPLLAIQQLGAGAEWMGLLSAAVWLPWLIIGLPAGAWVDQWSPRPVMIVANLVAAVALATIPVAWSLNRLSLPQLAMVAVTVGTSTVFFRGAYARLLPALVPSSQLESANARMFGTESAVHVAGPGLGALLTQWVTAALGIVVDVASYLISTWFLWRIKLPQRATGGDSTDREAGFLGRIRAGVAFVTHDRYLRVLLVIGGVSNFGLTGYAALLMLYLIRDLGLSPLSLGAVLMIGSSGGVLGAMAAQPLSRRFGSGRASTGLLLVAGLSALMIGLPTTASAVWLTATGLAVVGAAVVAGNVIRGAWRLRYVPTHLMARVITTSQVINYGTMPFAGLAAGWLGAALGVRTAVIALAAVHTLACFSVLCTALGRREELPEPC